MSDPYVAEMERSINGWRQENAGLRTAMKAMQELDQQARAEIAALKKRIELQELILNAWKEWEKEQEKERDALKKELEIARGERQWIKCIERMPEIDSEMLCFCEQTKAFFIGRYLSGSNFSEYDEERCEWQKADLASHWMPLPEGPKE